MALGMVVVIVTGWIAVRFFLPSAGKKRKFALGGADCLTEIEQKLMMDDPDYPADTVPLSPDEQQSSLIEKKAKKSEDRADPQPSWESKFVSTISCSLL